MFKLLIECSKDISEISINFTDGTSVVKSTEPESQPTQPTQPNQKPKFTEAREELLDLDYSRTESFSETVKKPDIVNPIRKAKVASELQNLDI